LYMACRPIKYQRIYNADANSIIDDIKW
jgi:hypothetical protein